MLKRLFTPFEIIDKRTLNMLAFIQVSILILIWSFAVPEQSFWPQLSDVFAAWLDLWNNGLFYHAFASLQLCFISIGIGIVISSLVAYSSTIPFFKPIVKFLSQLRNNPIQGFTLFLTTTTGGGRNLQISMLVIFMSFYFITALVSVIDEIPEEDIFRRMAMKMNRWQILWEVAIKDRLDVLLEVIRQNISIMLMMLVSVEAMYKSFGGLGALINDSTRALNFPKIFSLQITIFILGILLDTFLRFLLKQFPAHSKEK
jgi:ABC-type nitrate/sulfonate/bicarbonate transport system permease component